MKAYAYRPWTPTVLSVSTTVSGFAHSTKEMQVIGPSDLDQPHVIQDDPIPKTGPAPELARGFLTFPAEGVLIIGKADDRR